MDKSFQQNLRISYAISGYTALLFALVIGTLCIWTPFHAGYLTIAAAVGFMAFLIEWVQLRIRRQIGVIIFLVITPVQMIARHLLLLNSGYEHLLHPVQFLSVAIMIWQLLVFLCRKQLLRKLEQAATATTSPPKPA